MKQDTVPKNLLVMDKLRKYSTQHFFMAMADILKAIFPLTFYDSSSAQFLLAIN